MNKTAIITGTVILLVVVAVFLIGRKAGKNSI